MGGGFTGINNRPLTPTSRIDITPVCVGGGGGVTGINNRPLTPTSRIDITPVSRVVPTKWIQVGYSGTIEYKVHVM